jgi:hypothetical protein
MVLINIIHKESCTFFTCDHLIVWHKWTILVSRSTSTKIELTPKRPKKPKQLFGVLGRLLQLQ